MVPLRKGQRAFGVTLFNTILLFMAIPGTYPVIPHRAGYALYRAKGPYGPVWQAMTGTPCLPVGLAHSCG